ncbi:MAG: hypothetical protein ACRC5M_05270 [Anaeroplasmataceae bacterium]
MVHRIAPPTFKAILTHGKEVITIETYDDDIDVSTVISFLKKVNICQTSLGKYDSVDISLKYELSNFIAKIDAIENNTEHIETLFELFLTKCTYCNETVISILNEVYGGNNEF